MIITIDGYSGSGKSTLARILAEKLDYTHIDAGMLFRAITLSLMRKGFDFHNDQIDNCDASDFDLSFDRGRVYLGEEDVTDGVKDPAVTANVSIIGASESFRDLVYCIQQKVAQNRNYVFSGRDTGTAVFPKAELKFFVMADLTTRAERRLRQYLRMGVDTNLENVKADLAKRDEYDLAEKSLIRPEDSFEIDNTKSIEEVVDFMFAKAKPLL